MPVVPAVPTFTAEILSASELNQLGDALRFIYGSPIARLRQTVAQTLTTAVNTPITFTTEDDDTDIDLVGGHDNAVNTSRWTARYPGRYGFAGGIGFASNATGIRLCRFHINGTLMNDSDVLITPVSGNTTRMASRTTESYMSAGDYVEIVGTQTSGGNLNTSVAAGEQSHLMVWWIRS